MSHLGKVQRVVKRKNPLWRSKRCLRTAVDSFFISMDMFFLPDSGKGSLSSWDHLPANWLMAFRDFSAFPPVFCGCCSWPNCWCFCRGVCHSIFSSVLFWLQRKKNLVATFSLRFLLNVSSLSFFSLDTSFCGLFPHFLFGVFTQWVARGGRRPCYSCQVVFVLKCWF